MTKGSDLVQEVIRWLNSGASPSNVARNLSREYGIPLAKIIPIITEAQSKLDTPDQELDK